jgi:hypothetical protein
MQRILSHLLLALALPWSGLASPFQDVPPGHWAGKAVETVQKEGILQGRGDRFQGQRPSSRYELAAVANRLLGKIRQPGSASLTPQEAEDLQILVAQVGEDQLAMGDEVASLRATVSQLQERLSEVEETPNPRRLSLAPRLAQGIGQAMTGFLSVGLVRTQEGANGRGGGFTRYHLDGSRTLDQTFFSIPQASIAIHHEVSPGTLLHMQFDYTTDAANAVGGGVGLNEAYLRKDRLIGKLGGKIGGFALPFQDWEFDGPFRTLTATLTPSTIGTFLERFRVIGLEVSKLQDVDPADTRVRLGIFTGGDLPTTPTGDILPPPTQDDSVGLGALSRTATFDGQLGYYLDAESGDSPDQYWGWRLGAFNLGGDLDAGSTRTSSQDFRGLSGGLWWRSQSERLRLHAQFASATREFVRGTFSPTDLRSGYLRANWSLAENSNLSLRLEKFTFQNGTIQPGFEARNTTWLLAWNRKLSETDLLQVEFLTQDQPIPPRALIYPNGQPDPADDLVQLRYKLWF